MKHKLLAASVCPGMTPDILSVRVPHHQFWEDVIHYRERKRIPVPGEFYHHAVVGIRIRLSIPLTLIRKRDVSLSSRHEQDLLKLDAADHHRVAALPCSKQLIGKETVTLVMYASILPFILVYIAAFA